MRPDTERCLGIFHQIRSLCQDVQITYSNAIGVEETPLLDTKPGVGTNPACAASLPGPRRFPVVGHVDIGLTGHVVPIGSSSIEGGPGETGADGIFVRESPLGV